MEFLKGASGKDSNSRVIADLCIVVALIFCAIILYRAPNTELMTAATAISIVFGAIALPTMAFLFAQKTNEKKQLP